MIKQIGLLITTFTVLLSAWGTSAHASEYSNPYEWVGQAHNDSVLYVLDHMDEFSGPLSEFLPFSQAKVDEFIAEQNYPEIPEAVPSPQLDALLEIARTYDGRSLEEFQQTVLEFEQEAMHQLEGDKLATVQMVASVTRHSAQLWTLERYGGLDAGAGFGDTSTAFIDWGGVVEADDEGLIHGGLHYAPNASIEEMLKQLYPFTWDTIYL